MPSSLPSVRWISCAVLCCCVVVASIMPRPAHAQTIPLKVGVPSTFQQQFPTINVPSFASGSPMLVVFSTSDGPTIMSLNSLGLPNPVTLQALVSAFPMVGLVSNSITFTDDPMQPRFTVVPNSCNTMPGVDCTVQVHFSGAPPAGTDFLLLTPDITSATLSGADALVMAAPQVAATIATNIAAQISMFPLELTFDAAVGDQTIVFGAPPALTVGGSAPLSATGGGSTSPIVFASLTPAICTVSGSTVTGVATGTCTIQASQAADANFNAATPVTQNITVTLPNPARLGAISTRMEVLTADNVLIGGFVIGGSTPKTVVVRARGPSLASAGITNFLANPQLQLVFGNGTVVSNNGWLTAANAVAILSSGFAPSDSHESAILITLDPGAYTAIVSGAGGGTGVGIVEVFEVDHPEIPLAGISTRGEVLTGNDVMIGGVIIEGNAPQTVVVRARGPSLAANGVANPLANPFLQLVASDGTVITNDDWLTAPNAVAILSSGFAPADAHESAILVTLNPGAYTAIVSGVGGATGVGIVEVFTVP